jgi:cytoskeletal protein CcmA (bactofilin family)
VTGEIKQGFRAAGANVVIDGIVDGNVLVTGGSLTLGSKAHILGNVTAYTGQFRHHGLIDGSLEFAGGTAVLGGKVQDDANLTADALSVEPGARVEGDIAYSTRKPMDDELKAIAGGEVTYDEKPIETKREKEKEDRHLKPSKFGVGKWIAFFTASFLFGCALLAVFSDHEPKVTHILRTDPLRATGIGFVSILVTIAVCLSLILLITIPFVAIYLIAYVVAVYLAKIPVAVWVGRAILERLHRPGSPYLDLFVGLIALYFVFMLPFIGWLAWVIVAFLGLGAMTMAYLAHRQARKAATLAA